jgi:hypothetical protein
MKKIIFLFALSMLGSLHTQAQQKTSFFEKGQMELGMRSSLSLFSNDNPGLGYGGQFRLRFGERINTEWFADYLTTNIDDIGNRKDYHIGWAVMFYPFKTDKKLNQYFLAGHCFDYTIVSNNRIPTVPEISQSQSRFTSAVHLGLGTQYYFNEKFNVSLHALYMNHLGKDFHEEINYDQNGDQYLEITAKDWSLEGHILLTLSLNYKIADLW